MTARTRNGKPQSDDQTAGGRGTGALDHVVRSGVRWLSGSRLAAPVALVFLCLMALVPGLFSLPPVDRTEVVYAQTARQMLETGNWLAPRFQQRPEHMKPSGLFWLHASVATLAGEDARQQIWVYRSVTIAGAILSVLLLFYGFRPVFGPAVAFGAGAMTVTSLIVLIQGHLAMGELVFLACVIAGQAALCRIYVAARAGRTPGAGDAGAFWLAQGMAVLFNAFMLAVMSALTIIALVLADRRAGWLKALRAQWGLPLALALATPWFVTIWHATGGNPLVELDNPELWRRAFGPQEMQFDAPPLTFIFALWLGFWPHTLCLIPVMRHVWRERTAPGLRFLMAWALTFVLALEVGSNFPPLYTMQVLVPPVALALAWAMTERTDLTVRLRLGIPWLLVGFVAVGVLVAASRLAGIDFGLSAVALAGLMLAALVLLVVAASRDHAHATLALGLASGVLVSILAFAVVLPATSRIWTSERIAETRTRLSECSNGAAAFVGYHEPTSVFLSRDPTLLVSPSDAPRWLGEDDGRIAFVAEQRDGEFRSAYDAEWQRSPNAVACIPGINIMRGRKSRIQVYTAGPPERFAACRLPEWACEPVE